MPPPFDLSQFPDLPPEVAKAFAAMQFELSVERAARQHEQAVVAEKDAFITALQALIEKLEGQVLDYRRTKFGPKSEKLDPAFADLTRQLNGPAPDPKAGPAKRPFELVVANALWGQKGFPFRPEFIERTGKFYGAALTEVDYKTAAEQARQTINAWVEKQTNDKIKDLIPGGALNQDTRLVLTNAVYFKGKWSDPFEAAATRDRPFHLLPGGDGAKTVQAPMMHKGATAFGYFKADGIAALELPYAGDELSMLVLLPDKNDGLAELEKKLTAQNLARWMGLLRRRQVEVVLPRFKMTCQFSLKQKLQEMGMAEAFSDSADFSGMVEGGGLKLTDVLHKAFVDVNEEGTEAAGATAVVVGVTSVMIDLPPVFQADRPFVFLIRHKPTGAVLFLGRLTDPRQAGA